MLQCWPWSVLCIKGTVAWDFLIFLYCFHSIMLLFELDVDVFQLFFTNYLPRIEMMILGWLTPNRNDEIYYFLRFHTWKVISFWVFARKVKRHWPIIHWICQKKGSSWRVGIRAKGGLDSPKTPDQKSHATVPLRKAQIGLVFLTRPPHIIKDWNATYSSIV